MTHNELNCAAVIRLPLFSLPQALSTYGKEVRNDNAELPDVAGVLSDLALALALEGRYVRTPRLVVLPVKTAV